MARTMPGSCIQWRMEREGGAMDHTDTVYHASRFAVPRATHRHESGAACAEHGCRCGIDRLSAVHGSTANRGHLHCLRDGASMARTAYQECAADFTGSLLLCHDCQPA